MSASLRPSSFPTQPILRRQSSDSKRPRLGESELEVSHWNGDTFVCAHSKSERFDPDVAVHPFTAIIAIIYEEKRLFACL